MNATQLTVGQDWVPVLQIRGAIADRIGVFRDGQLKMALSELFPAALDFVNEVRTENDSVDQTNVWDRFVTATLWVEHAMDCAKASGILPSQARNAASQMLGELRYETRRSLTEIDNGISMLDPLKFKKTMEEASSRMDFLWKLCAKTLGIKRSDLAQEIQRSNANGLRHPGL